MTGTEWLRAVRNGPDGPLVDVAIRDGRVAAVAASYPVAGQAYPPGATVLPGLHDGHVHLTQWAVAGQRVPLATAPSAAVAAELMAAAARERDLAPGQVLTGFGFRDGLWADAPDRELLQRALPDVPAVLISQDLHCCWLSPAALRLIGSDHETGLLREDQAFAAMAALPGPPADRTDAWAMRALADAAARGVTQILDFEFTDTIAVWQRRYARSGGLPVRVRAAIWRPRLDDVVDAGLRTGDPVPGTDGWVTVGPCKVLMDGSLNTRTALCHDPYEGRTGPEAAGMLTSDPDELTETMRSAWLAGISFAVHAIGDRANTLALDCFGRSGAPGRIEHAQLVAPADLRRFARLGVIAGVQPAHLVDDRDVAEHYWHGRTGSAFPFADLLAAGATLEFGSDAPVARLDPWLAIACAVARTDDDRPAWHGEQRVTFEQALRASTGGRVRLSVGDPADMVVVGQDPSQMHPSQLPDIEVLATMVGGRFSYRAG